VITHQREFDVTRMSSNDRSLTWKHGLQRSVRLIRGHIPVILTPQKIYLESAGLQFQHFGDALLIEPRIDIDSNATMKMPTH
jgi:hypothetical protein